MMESLGFGLWRHRTRHTDSPSLLQFAANAVLLKKLHSFPSAYVWEDNYRLVTLGWTVPLKGRVGSGLDSEVSLGNESVLTLSFRNSSGWGLTVETFAAPKRCHYWGVKMTRNFFFFFFNICSSRSDGLCSVHEPRSTTAVNQRDSLEVALPKTEKMWQCSNPVTWQTVTLQREVVLTVQHSVQSVCGWTGTFARTNLQARNAEEGGSKWSIGNILKSAVYAVTVCTDAIFFL